MNVLLIVDQYRLRQDATQKKTEMDPQRDAQLLSQLIKPFGWEAQRIALVAQEDTEGLTAYNGAGFQTTAMNGSRQDQLRRLIAQLVTTIQRDKPRQVVLVTTDPDFETLCSVAAHNEHTNVTVWAPRASVPSALNNPDYNYMPLEELLPHLKVARVDVRLDYENLHIGLERQGWQPDPKALIEAVKKESANLGKLIRIVAYADWDEIAKGSERNFQRELALLGVETRYQVNLHGKNSADMKIADEIRSLVERDTSESEAVDVIALGTRDRDFRPVIETAKARGKRVVILALKDGLSGEIKTVADEVRYLDDHLLPKQRREKSKPNGATRVTADNEHAELALRTEVWLRQQGWKWSYTDNLAEAVVSGPDGKRQLHRAVDAGVFTRRTRSQGNGRKAETLMPNPNHPLVKTVRHLVEWAPSRIAYCLYSKGMPYVDSNYLARGMQMDKTFRELGAGQSRPDAEGWLHLAADAGLIEKVPRKHPKPPHKLIDTWVLPAEYVDPELMQRWLITSADSNMAEYDQEWAPIKTLHNRLGFDGHGAFQEVLDTLQESGAAYMEKHKPAGHKFPVTGLHLQPDAPSVTTVRAERRIVLTHLRDMAEGTEAITQDALIKHVTADNAAALDAQTVRGWLRVLEREEVLQPLPDAETWALDTRHPLWTTLETKGDALAAPTSLTEIQTVNGHGEHETTSVVQFQKPDVQGGQTAHSRKAA